MAPDLNSLPQSNSPTIPPTPGPGPGPGPGAASSSSHSPHAPASPRQHSPTLHHRSSPRLNLQRRASSRLGSFSLNDSAGSSPVTADPHHQRQPSLGELHQELEEEQEAQVNRLLSLIRLQQATIAAYESSSPAPPPSTTAPSAHAHAPDDSTPGTAGGPHPAAAQPTSPSPSTSRPPNAAAAAPLSRNSSRRSHSSYTSSPGVHSLERGRHAARNGEAPPLDRDELALAHAEAQLVARENQMLKGRIRELERQVAEARREREREQGAGG